MATIFDLQDRGLRHGVIVDAAVTTADLATLERAGLRYKVEVASGVTAADRATLDRRGLQYFVPVAVGVTAADKAALERQGLRYAVQVDADIIPADRAALEQQGLSYFVEVDSSGNSVAPGPGFSAEALAFFARLATQPTAPRKTQYATLIDALVAGGVWAKLDTLYVFAAVDQATALTNLVQSSYGATATGAPTFTGDQGFTGAASKYLDTGFNPTTAGSPKLTQNSANLFVWSGTVAAQTNAAISYNAAAGLLMILRYTNDTSIYRIHNASGLTPVNTDGSGLFVGSRTSSVATTCYRNGAQAVTSGSHPSAVLQNSTISFFKSSSTYYTGLLYCGGFGSGLTAGEVTTLYNALHVYLQAVAGVA